jgi:curved DNA-binding protein CbpA
MQNEQYKQFNCYKILNLAQNATPQEIHLAYKQASLRSHPDLGGSHEEMVKVNIAYDILSNPIERQAHDIYWRTTATSSYSVPPSSKVYNSQQTNNTTTQTPPKAKSTYQAAPKNEPLAGIRKRVYQQVEWEKTRIKQDLNNRKQKNEAAFKKEFSNKRQETFFIFVGVLTLVTITTASHVAILWFGVIYLCWLLVSRLGGVKINNRIFSIFEFKSTEKLREHAEKTAQESCDNDIKNLDRHFSSLASLVKLLLRFSTFDDSEEQVARRLTASFFMMGYMPLQYDGENRIILFTDGAEQILVRFRHRDGVATNITYVEKMISLMDVHGTARGFLFCSPGLSGNAANLANLHKVKWYTLEAMNEWIDQVLTSDYSGPPGDILVNIDKLNSFIATLSPMISARSSRPRYWSSRYRY